MQNASSHSETMNRTNTLYLVIGALCVATILLGYLFYESQQRPQGVVVGIGADGISIEER